MKKKHNLAGERSVWVALARIGDFSRPQVVTVHASSKHQAMQCVIDAIGPCHITKLVNTKKKAVGESNGYVQNYVKVDSFSR